MKTIAVSTAFTAATAAVSTDAFRAAFRPLTSHSLTA